MGRDRNDFKISSAKPIIMIYLQNSRHGWEEKAGINPYEIDIKVRIRICSKQDRDYRTVLVIPALNGFHKPIIININKFLNL